MPRPVAETATLAFADALLWNWLIAGTDAHAKNYSLLLLGAAVRLAPFHDVASALPYGQAEQRLQLAMKLGGGYAINPASSPWRRLAADLQLPEDNVRDRAAHLVASASDAFADAAGQQSVRDLGSPLPPRLADLVAERVRRCAKQLIDWH